MPAASVSKSAWIDPSFKSTRSVELVVHKNDLRVGFTFFEFKDVFWRMLLRQTCSIEPSAAIILRFQHKRQHARTPDTNGMPATGQFFDLAYGLKTVHVPNNSH